MNTCYYDMPHLLRAALLSLLAIFALSAGSLRAEEGQPKARLSNSESKEAVSAAKAKSMAPPASAVSPGAERLKGTSEPTVKKRLENKPAPPQVSVPAEAKGSTEDRLAKRSQNKKPSPGSEKLLPSDSQSQGKLTIGAISQAQEQQSQLTFRARVDTGAKSCSIHAVKFVIKDPAEEMEDNIGKPIRVKIQNHRDESKWIDTKIGRLVRVKTSERAELRYAVPLLLVHGELEKEVSVTLNDRSHMVYPLLLGRNFLHGDFVVDVEIPQ
ncbi:putative ATP-dependent zinc protease [Adhaeretor mobilis]|uniref:Retropepsin-like aspartic endopeptidase domain-containing protein n=1 Tax=Adhaeretor mobilis TaxID=1930276 RepID=A0A517MQS7_9BACT|nr:RimK/LysX family protein [Adhaeretor mobilis]QDS97235.1 hypothetical protein HG15A2_04960 [Adhaeretor mobilis]